MKKRKLFILFFVSFVSLSGVVKPIPRVSDDERFISYEVDLQKQDLKLFWKDNKNELFRNFKNLKTWLNAHQQELVFAMNGGMYKTDNAPLGLFIEDGKTISAINKLSGDGNFYLKPNGVFYTTYNNSAAICQTGSFVNTKKIKYATQSGPLLVINGNIHPAFNPASTNLNIRNGVGILPGNKIVFAMSKRAINFYDFAKYFKDLGCSNALYLDGFVSRTWLPEKQFEQVDGNFGVIIAVTRAMH